jgi:hypothetical protein
MINYRSSLSMKKLTRLQKKLGEVFVASHEAHKAGLILK